MRVSETGHSTEVEWETQVPTVPATARATTANSRVYMVFIDTGMLDRTPADRKATMTLPTCWDVC